MMKWCGLLLLLSFPPQSEGCVNRKELEINVGHVFILTCLKFQEDEVNVTWTRALNQGWDAGVRVINQSVWFLPVQESHSGNYSCFFSSVEEPRIPCENHFSITVSRSKCSTKTSEVVLPNNSHGGLKCDINKINMLQSGSILGWTWMKDCKTLTRQETSDSVHRFSSVSPTDEGVYTCILNFTYNGASYTMAYSRKVLVRDLGPVPQKPSVITPQQETLPVNLNSKQVLHCKVFVGFGSCDSDTGESTKPYWLVNGSFIEEYPQHFATDYGCTVEDNMNYHHSNLTIFKVQKEFLNIPFQCIFHSSMGHDNGTIILTESSQRQLYCALAVLSAYAVVALGFLLFYLCKVDLVLAYRKLSPCLTQPNDGKPYDAYVSYPHDDDHSVSSAKSFALHILPEVLEDRLGYKLFISGRDALPGEAVHDVISEMVAKSRRLIVVLPSQPFAKSSNKKGGALESLSLNNNLASDLSESSLLNSGPYECWVGLHDALVKECLQVILVQVGGEVDDALLSESLRYIRYTQGILKWKKHYTSQPNGRFWKLMRYRMPPVRKSKTAVMV